MIDVAVMWDTYMRAKRVEEGPKPTAAGTLMRVSDVGSCLRQRGFSALKIPETEQIDAGTLLAFALGDAIHGQLQAAVLASDDSAVVEVPIDLTDAGPSLSGHCDGLLDNSDVILEIKSVGGYAAKLVWKAGPKTEHIAQAALYAIGTGASHVLLVYVAKEKDWRAGISPGDMREWLFHLDDDCGGDATPRELAEEELARFGQVERTVNDGMLPDRLIPDDDNVLRVEQFPGPYGEASKGSSWQCRYCRHNTVCCAVGGGEVPVSDIPEGFMR